MSRNTLTLTLIALVLGGLYIYGFTDWFREKTIQIIPSHRPMAGANGALVNPIAFGLDGEYPLTSIKVVILSAWETNKLVPPVWHLITTSNSVPTKGFLYGMQIEGMKFSPLKNGAESLKPNVTYRLFLEAGKARGMVDFKPTPATRDF